MDVVVGEDEALAAERLIQLIQLYDQSINIIYQSDTVTDIVNFFQTGRKIDLLFLDIQLADGKSFSIFDKVKVHVPIIFTTAYDEYALQAFKLNSIDYLLKPIQETELKIALDKFKRLSPGYNIISDEEIKIFKSLLNPEAGGYKERFIVKSGNKLQYKPVSTIAYFYAEGKTAYLVTKSENRKYLIDQTLEGLEAILNPRIFFRISRKVIVSIDSVMEVRGMVSTGLVIKLSQTCDFDLSVSRDRTQNFKEWLDR